VGKSLGSRNVFIEVVTNVTNAYKAAFSTRDVLLTSLMPKG
jgi:hypothetical protein